MIEWWWNIGKCNCVFSVSTFHTLIDKRAGGMRIQGSGQIWRMLLFRIYLKRYRHYSLYVYICVWRNYKIAYYICLPILITYLTVCVQCFISWKLYERNSTCFTLNRDDDTALPLLRENDVTTGGLFCAWQVLPGHARKTHSFVE